MPFLSISVSDDVARWIEEQAVGRGISAEAFAAQLLEAAAQQGALSRDENRALRCFIALRAGPGAYVLINNLWRQWSTIEPGSDHAPFNAALDSLAERGLVIASDASGSAFKLTPAGFKAAREA